jgi:hypothetical protein
LTPEDSPKELLPYVENHLSPFAGMVAAVDESRDGTLKSHPWLVNIYAKDSARDQTQNNVVVFARVIEGLETVERLCQLPFNTAAEADLGQGSPRALITIKSVEVLD